MSHMAAGSTVEYTVTWLEMEAPLDVSEPVPPDGESVRLLGAENAPVWYFFCLYDGVGRDYAWEDMHDENEEKVAAFVTHPEVRIYSMIREGWPQGFFMLDSRVPGVCDISYLGLARTAIGRGLGTWLLKSAIYMASRFRCAKKVTVNTCTLDHPAAKAMYIKNGFAEVRERVKTRVLRRDYKRDSCGRN